VTPFSGGFRSHGRVDASWNAGRAVINRNSIVVASLTEVSHPEGESFDLPHLGAADMVVENIVPRDDGIVTFRCHIDWGSDLDIRISGFIA
jgi:hypothetical protein